MLHLNEMAPIDGLSATLRSGRGRLAKVDLESVGTAASSAARTILPRAWIRPRPRRWPFVVGMLLFGSLIGILVLFRQPILELSLGEATAKKPDPGGPPEPDASDVVSGPIGDAGLRDPATSGPEGADLSRLHEIEVDPDEAEPSPTIIR